MSGPIRAIIVDDEPLARRGLELRLAAHDDIQVVQLCGNGREALEAIAAHSPDLMFLDIEMPGIDGFEVLRRIPQTSMPMVVFVTAFDRYALKAFEAHAVDYLMKPFSTERLRAAVDRARAEVDRSSSKELKAALHALLEDIQRERTYPEWLLIKRDDRSVFLRVADIDWIESSRNNVRLHVGKDIYLFHETTSGIESRLDPKKFFRIHRSTIVNIEKIKEMHPWFNGDYAVILKDGTKLTLSSTYRERLKEFRRLAV
jgi:two-component system LytT family response regulator